MGYSYKGAISFGLIYIPIQLSLAIKNKDISFNMLDKKTMSRIQYKKTCVDCNNQEIEAKDIVKGYEYDKDKYVIFTDEDFEKIKSEKDKTITIENFVLLDQVDPLYFDKHYYVIPSGAYKAFNLLKLAMEKENKVGIAKTVLGNKAVLILLRVKDKTMFLSTLHFQEEVARNPYEEVVEKIDNKELSLAKMIINNMTTPFNIDRYKDEYKDKVIQAIELKIQGKEYVVAKQEKVSEVTNLMEALENSLKATQAKQNNDEKEVKPKKGRKKITQVERSTINDSI